MMQPSPLTSRSLGMCSLVCVAILCLFSLGQGLRVLAAAPTFVGPRAGTVARRTWESELGPFSPGPPDELNNEEHQEAELVALDDDGVAGADAVQTANAEDSEKIWPLPNPLGEPLLSAVTSILGWHVGGGASSTLPPSIVTLPPVSVPSAGGEPNLFGSVLTILAPEPDITPVVDSPGGNRGPLGGLLSALSQIAPSQILPTSLITAPPSVPTGVSGGGGLLPGLSVLDGVASALNGILGTPDEDNSGGIGLLGQLSANVLGPITSIVPDPASVLADPAAAVWNLQSQVSAVLDSMPSALAAGIQLANNVGNDLADALNATSDLLDAAPDVAGGVADQVGCLLNAAPNLATGLPAVALDAVNQMENILNANPTASNDFAGMLNGMKSGLSAAVASAAPDITTLAGAMASGVVRVLPTGLQPLVSGALSSIQANAAGLLCQVSDTIGGTALVFGVPCDEISVTAGPPSTAATAAVPASVSASLTLVESLPFAPTAPPSPPPSSPPSGSPQLASLLSSLSSSVLSAAATATPAGSFPADPLAISALSGLSSLISQVSQLSLTAPSSPSSALTPGPVTPPSTIPTASETTIYYIQTITALVTSTETQTNIVSTCPSAFDSYSSAPNNSPTGGSGGYPGIDGSDGCPCPGQGYTCDDCPGGWFCPPLQTPAVPAPCGYGWLCYHCQSGWFCAPSTSAPGAVVHMYSTPISNVAFATSIPATSGYQLIGCYQDDQDRALKGAQLLTLAGGMTNEACIDFCQGQGFILAGTEDGSQCFCGNTLVGSAVMGDEVCNISCAGDAMNSTTCGGAWALSVWSLDDSIPQGQSSEKSFSPLISGPAGMPMGPGPVVPSTLVPAAATYAAESWADSILAPHATAATNAMDADDDATAVDNGVNRSKAGSFPSSRSLAVMSDGSYVFSVSPSVQRGRRISRRRTH